MSPDRSPVSLGALALILCIALPTGVLSYFADVTTGEAVDRADAVFVGRVTGMQYEAEADQTFLAFAVNQTVLGEAERGHSTFRFEGRAPLRVGDDAVLLVEGRPASVIGYLVVQKSPLTSELEIVSPISGMVAQGVGASGGVNLQQFKTAVLVRRGMVAPGPMIASSALPPPPTGVTVPADPYEPNNDLASAFPVAISAPHAVTGMPTLLSDLTLSRDDVDFFLVDTLALGLLHAKTFETNGSLDTVLGVFDGVSGQLLAFNDDDPSGSGDFSSLSVPTELGGPLAIAVAPFADTDFDGAGADPANLGDYGLSLEVTTGKYLWNQVDQMLGLSQDGTFIQDQVGYRMMDGGKDVLLPGMQADGWALRYLVGMLPSGVTQIYGGGGDQLSDPGFTHPLLPISFSIQALNDAAGNNRKGLGRARLAVTQQAQMPFHGTGIEFLYAWSLGSQTLMGSLKLQVPVLQDVSDVLFTRVMDVDLFGEGADRFYWHFDPNAKAKCFAVDLATNVGSVPVPASSSAGPVASDLQAALRIDHGDEGESLNKRAYESIYPTAFTLVNEQATELAAHDAAVANLQALGLTTWVIGVDQDPDSGTWCAFGIGMTDP